MKQPVYPPGTMIGAKYRIDEAIARGGCSIVYRGTHVEMNRIVALKIMSSGEGELDAAWTRRFQREARLASHLRHPNTIIVYDYGHDKGLWYIAMEWVEGASLRNVIKEHGPMEAKRTARLTIQMHKSLSEAHRHHILHRDLKPSNIMLTHDMEGDEMVKVLDFGLAKTDPREMSEEQLKLTRDGDFVGTPRYASPEQLRGRELTSAADIYGVGMVMWEMLTGSAAVPKIDYATCVEYHLGPRPWRMPPGVYSPGLASIVERALEKDASRRFQGCEEMHGALTQWLDGEENKHVALFAQEPGLFDDVVEAVRVGGDESPVALQGLPGEEVPVAPRTKRAVQAPHRGKRASAFSQLRGESLRLDRVAKTPSTPRQPRPRRAPMADRPRTPPAVWGAGVLIVAIGVAAVIYLFGMREVSEHVVVQEDPLVEGLEPRVREGLPPKREGRRARLAAQLETRAPKDLLVYLRSRGWSFPEPEVTKLAGIAQTTLRMRRKRAAVDATFYELDELSLARDFEYNTQAPAVAVRFGLTVVRINPVGRNGQRAVEDLRGHLLGLGGDEAAP